MVRPKLSIEEWQQTRPVGVAASCPGRLSPNARLMGVVGTLLLHTILVHSVVLGSHTHKFRPPDELGLGAVRLQSTTPPSETLILLELPNLPIAQRPLLEDVASRGPLSSTTAAALLSEDPLPHVDIPAEELSTDSTSDAPIDSGDPSQRAALFGRYTGQIDARIERAWRRPRSPVNAKFVALQSSTPSVHGAPTDDPFNCQVRIIQDAHGFVQEVQLLRCNGSPAWRQSLVAAILSASPLPAPSDPVVFTQAITMTFKANPYTVGSSADDYEIETTGSALTAAHEHAPAASMYSRAAYPAGILLAHPTH